MWASLGFVELCCRWGSEAESIGCPIRSALGINAWCGQRRKQAWAGEQYLQQRSTHSCRHPPTPGALWSKNGPSLKSLRWEEFLPLRPSSEGLRTKGSLPTIPGPAARTKGPSLKKDLSIGLRIHNSVFWTFQVWVIKSECCVRSYLLTQVLWGLNFWEPYYPSRIYYKLWIFFLRKMQIHKEHTILMGPQTP